MNGIKPINPVSLGSMYDGLKTSINSNPLAGVTPTGDALRIKLNKHCDHLKDGCYKHLLLDVYCKILPLDKEYIDGHMGQMKGDIDGMLQAKGMTPTQYMTSCYNATKAPMLEFVIRSVNNIGSQYIKEAEEEIKDAKDNGMDIPIPEAPEDPTDDADIDNQLVDVKDDIEYDQFVDTLKKKTIDKIVNDVSKIIEDEKSDDDMAFDPKPLADVQEEMESTTSIGLSYLQKHLIQEGVDTSSLTEELLGYAIRESTLQQFDIVFRQPGTSFKEFVSRIRYGKGSIINESAVDQIIAGVISDGSYTESTRYSREYNHIHELKIKLVGLKYDLKKLSRTYEVGSDDYKYVTQRIADVTKTIDKLRAREGQYTGGKSTIADSLQRGREAAVTIAKTRRKEYLPDVGEMKANYDIHSGKKEKKVLMDNLVSSNKSVHKEVKELFNKYLKESTDTTPEDVNGVVDKAKKEMDDKINSKLKASDVIDAKNKDKDDK